MILFIAGIWSLTRSNSNWNYDGLEGKYASLSLSSYNQSTIDEDELLDKFSQQDSPIFTQQEYAYMIDQLEDHLPTEPYNPSTNGYMTPEQYLEAINMDIRLNESIQKYLEAVTNAYASNSLNEANKHRFHNIITCLKTFQEASE